MSRRGTRREAREPGGDVPRRAQEGGTASAAFRASDLLDPREPFLFPLLLLIVARAVMWISMPAATEDAFITFRYARHLATGHGLVYNPGEHVYGFSSPLWTIWNALGYWLTKDPVSWARAWSIAADALSLVCMGALLRRHLSRQAAWCFTFFFAVWPYFAAASISGMESGVMLALIAGSATLIEARSPLLGPVLAALALVRPEGLAAAAVLALGARWRDRAIALVLVALSLAGLYAYYGTIVPQSVVAKSHIYGITGLWGGRHWWEWLVPFPLGRWPATGDTVPLAVIAVVLAPSFVLGIPELWRLRRTGLALGIAAGLVIWLGYAVLGVAYFWWYLVVPLAAVVAAAAAGFPKLARSPALAITSMLYLLGIWTLHPKTYIGRSQTEAMNFGRAAQYLRAHSRPGDKVLLEPIGMVGYYAPVVVVDEVGLVSPEVVKRRQRGAGWYTDVEAAERPNWLVLRTGVMRGGEAFAGVGAPFRSAAERESLLAHYVVMDPGVVTAGTGAMAVLKRTR